MNDDPAASDETAERDGAIRLLRRHILAYAAVNGALFLIDLLTPGPWWFLWPMFGWGVAVAAHWLYVKSVTIDDDWAQRRAEDIRLQASDRGHIESIRESYEKSSSRFEKKGPDDGSEAGDAEPEPDETLRNRP